MPILTFSARHIILLQSGLGVDATYKRVELEQSILSLRNQLDLQSQHVRILSLSPLSTGRGLVQ
jgi:hypothetical protein